MIAVRAARPVWTPRRLATVPAAMYAPWDITTLWQDSARTVPVTAYGQPIGAMDDVSGNSRHELQATEINRPTYAATPATFGSELVTDGDMSNAGSWTAGTGIVIAAGVAQFTAASADLSQTITGLAAGKLYRLIYTVSARSAGTLQPKFTGGTAKVALTVSNNSTYTLYIRACTSNTALAFTGATATLALDNVSLKEVLTFTGAPGVLTDGVTEFLAAAYIQSAYPVTLVATALINAANGGTAVLSLAQGDAQYKALEENGTTTFRCTDRNAANNADNAPNTTAGVAHVVIADMQAATKECFANNTTNGSTANSNAFGTSANIYIGKTRPAGLFFPGYFYGGMVSSATLTATERGYVNDYYAKRNGII